VKTSFCGQILVAVNVPAVVDVLIAAGANVPLAQICQDESPNIPALFAVEVCHIPQRACANDDAPKNISSMLITLDTSHLDILLLNNEAYANIFLMLVTFDTSHLDMSPLNDDA